MPRQNQKPSDPRNLLKEEPAVQENWSVRVEDFDDSHAKHIWDIAFSKALEVALEHSQRGNNYEDKLRMLAKNTQIACNYADRVLVVYAEHRRSNKGVFVAATEIMNQES